MSLNVSGKQTLFEYPTSGIILSTFEIFLMIPILLGNILTVVAVITTPHLQTVTNRFVVSLAMSDVVMGVTMPFYPMFILMPFLHTSKFACLFQRSSKFACLFQYIWIIQPIASSLLNLCMICIDRFIAIKFPLRYPSLMTPLISSVLIGGIWIYTVTWGMADGPPLCLFRAVVPTAYIFFFVIGQFNVVVVTMLISYAIIFKEVHRKSKRINAQIPHGVNMSSAKSEAKTVKTLAIVFGIFVMCWVPFFLVNSVITTLDRIDIDSIHNATFILGLSNSCMNPLIYGLRNKDFRRAYLIMLHLRKRQNECVP